MVKILRIRFIERTNISLLTEVSISGIPHFIYKYGCSVIQMFVIFFLFHGRYTSSISESSLKLFHYFLHDFYFS